MAITEMTVKERITRLRRGEVLPGYKKTEVGVVPEGWEVETLATIGDIKGGITKDSNRSVHNCLRVPYLSTANVQRGYLDLSNVSYIEAPSEKIIELTLLPGDILFIEGGDRDKLARGCVWNGEIENCIYQNHVFRLRLKERFANSIFVSSYTNTFGQKYFLNHGQQTTNLATVNLTGLKQFPIPIPPLPEQRRIAEILSAWDEALEKFDLLIEKKRELKRGLMQVLLSGKRRFPEFDSGRLRETEIGPVPEEWEVFKFKEIAKEFICGGTPTTDKEEYWNGKIPWIKSSFIMGFYIKSGQKFITQTGLENSATNIVPAGSIIFATRVGMGKVAINLIDLAISQDLTGIVIDQVKLSIEFICWQFLSPQMQKVILSYVRGTTVKGITRNELENLPLPLPPLPEQRRIADCLSALDREIELLEREKAQRQTQKKALMELLLTGKVRVDVTDKEKNDGQE